jgi:hypothetical protein
LATGGSFATRELYTTFSEKVIEACRPVVLNGIDDILTRMDILSRAICVPLPVIPNSERKTMQELKLDLAVKAPRIFGVLLDALSFAIRNSDTVRPSDLPRLADFVDFASAAETSFGFDQGAVATAMDENQKDATLNALALDVVGSAFLEHISEVSENTWKGTASELYLLLTPEFKRPRTWPADVANFSKRLFKLSGALRDRGVELDRDRASGGDRYIVWMKTAAFMPFGSLGLDDEDEHPTQQSDWSDGLDDDHDSCMDEENIPF